MIYVYSPPHNSLWIPLFSYLQGWQLPRPLWAQSIYLAKHHLRNFQPIGDKNRRRMISQFWPNHLINRLQFFCVLTEMITLSTFKTRRGGSIFPSAVVHRKTVAVAPGEPQCFCNPTEYCLCSLAEELVRWRKSSSMQAIWDFSNFLSQIRWCRLDLKLDVLSSKWSGRRHLTAWSCDMYWKCLRQNLQKKLGK